MLKSNFLKLNLWAHTLVAITELSNPTISSLSRYLRSSYPHTFNVINVLKFRGLINLSRDGRCKIVSLTDDGWLVVGYIKSLKNIIGEC